MKFYQVNKPKPLTIGIIAIFLLCTGYSPANAQKCNDCFDTELINYTEEDNCLSVELKISAQNCVQALSHFTVEIPCGTVTEASNSEQWPMELNSTDPTTNIYGLKVDDITNFGEDGLAGTFTVNYTVCSDDATCRNELLTKVFTVAYKAGECIFTDTLILDNYSLDATLIPSNISCYGYKNGSIETSITNGTAPFTYAWNNGASSSSISNLSAGEFSVTITDATGASLDLKANITEPEAIIVDATTKDAQCGLQDGEILLTVTGGMAPYHYLWNTSDTIASLTNLDGGNYEVTITDALNCSQIRNFQLLNQTDLRASINTSVIECHEEGTGSLSVEVRGGTAPYTYLWANGDTTATASKLNSGTHKVTIVDANGCSISKTGYVIAKKIKVSHSVQEPICDNDSSGSISLIISDGTEPYRINWSSGDTTATIDKLTGGWYWAEITDSMGCTAREYVKVSEPGPISITTSVKRLSCQEMDSTMLVSVEGSGGTPPYDIYYQDELIDGQIEVDKEGYYEFTAIDANDCSITKQVYIKRPDAGLSLSLNVQQSNCEVITGSATINIQNGTSPYAIKWSDGNTDSSRTGLTAGDYLVTVEDANGCMSTEAFTINSIAIPSVSLIAPDVMPNCHSADNVIDAVVENADNFKWSITDSTNTWFIQSELINQLVYSSGEGTINLSLAVSSADGCTAIDNLNLSCLAGDNSGGGDGDNGGTDNDSIPEADCDNTCFDIKALSCEKTSNGCYHYSAKVTTDGSCEHELSHLSVQVENGYVNSLSNSRNWKVELNNTDPTTGLHGFKIDDIGDFGKYPDHFNIEFEICYNNDQAQSTFKIAYKAALCIATDTLTFEIPKEEIEAKSYPNPFVNEATVEFIPKEDTYATLNIYGVNGELIECLFKGNVEANTSYSFNFKSRNSGSNIYFYRLVCGEHSDYGKLIQTR